MVKRAEGAPENGISKALQKMFYHRRGAFFYFVGSDSVDLTEPRRGGGWPP